MSDYPWRARAEALAGTQPSLSALIAFTRGFDPTLRLRAAWGNRYDQRVAWLNDKVDDMRAIGADFPGTQEEVLLCMAHLVASAPYLGLPEESVRWQLESLLNELVAQG